MENESDVSDDETTSIVKETNDASSDENKEKD